MTNRITNTRFAIFALGAMCLSIMIACQTAQLAPYTKFASEKDVPRISVEDAKKDYDNGTVVMIDSRAEAAYQQEHIAGAINVPHGLPDNPRFSEIPKGKKIIVYCS